MNSYQEAKAKKIAAVILGAYEATTIESRNELAKIAARFTNDHWRTISFAAGVPVPDIAAKRAVLDILRKRSIHAR